MAERPDSQDNSAARLGVVRGGTVRSARELLQPEAAPKPPVEKKPEPLPRKRSRSRVVSALSGALTLLLFLGAVAAVGGYFATRHFQSPGPLPADKIVYIPKGTGVDEIGSILEREGVISNAGLFEAGVRIGSLMQMMDGVKAGEYQFKQSASLLNVLDTLSKGQVILHSVTIPEGLTSEQIVNRLRDFEFLSGEVADIPREGALMPTTHRFERGTHRQQVIERLSRDQRAAIDKIWRERDKAIPLRSPQEMVILASIVEKETGRADERTRVAAVFINRLNQKIKLQSDPTIVYGIVGGKGPLGRPLSRADIDKATPYNTYAISGLPPGPIANPGRAALEAVAKPSRTKDLFFVADGTGGHAFSETLEQHNRNVARWRQIEQGISGGTLPAGQPAPLRAGQPAPLRPPGPRTQILPPGFIAPAAAAVAAPLRAEPAAPAAASAYTVPQLQLDTLRSAVDGMADAGEIDIKGETPVESWPVPAGRRAAPKPQSDDPESTVPLRAQRRAAAPAGRAPGLDASTGTAKDPLLNRNFDLSTGKTVPSLR